MERKLLPVGAIVILTVGALLLQGSQARSTVHDVVTLPAVLQNQIRIATGLSSSGKFVEARALYDRIAIQAEALGAERAAAMNWNNAGACSLQLLQYGAALKYFTRAKAVAEAAGLSFPVSHALNNLASLYLGIGQADTAMNMALAGLRLPQAEVDPTVRAKTEYQLAFALMKQNRFDEATPIYHHSIDELMDRGNLDTAARELGAVGTELIKANRLAEAEWALSEGLRLARIHRLSAAANILRGLAKLRSAQGDAGSAAILFDAALAEPSSLTPRWILFADRGSFRLAQGQFTEAFADYRDARRIVAQMRADIVPADQDRIALESGLSLVMEGLVDSGNRLEEQTGDRTLLQDTFDAAEQDRVWSLRLLVPGAADWRTRLPEHYWQLLAQFQTLERSEIAGHTPESKTTPLKLEMQQIEARAASDAGVVQVDTGISPMAHVLKTMDSDSVLLSFHVTGTSSWVWTVDRERTDVYRLPPISQLGPEVAEFSRAVRMGEPSTEMGRNLYRQLFGAIPAAYLAHAHWLLEPDGPLYELPFAALVAGEDSRGHPVYLIERAAIQAIPSALLLQHGTVRADGEFLGIGDPVYNMADPRFSGRKQASELTLPRLPNTALELAACARAWNPERSHLLLGTDAREEKVEQAMKTSPSIIQFATHVIASPGEFRSGLIALSLDSHGAMGLLGPTAIVAHPVRGSIVVMDGCHSSQGEALAGAGLMGLTRAWIGAGAQAVIATEWDVPDDAAQSVMTEFYTQLKAAPQLGLASALRTAQIREIGREGARQRPADWAGYFLMSRM